MSRILGLDYGERRIGVALSDPTDCFASPLCVLDARSPSLLKDIRRLCREHGVGQILLGLPLRMDGTEGPAAVTVRTFAKKITGSLDTPVAFWDERLSTVSAERSLIEGGARRALRRSVVDKVAAQIFLQHYLDSRTTPQVPLLFDEEDPS